MSTKITGFNTQIVQRVNNRLDKFDESNKACQASQKKLDELAAKNVELVDLPAHEALYQTHLDEYKKAAENLKADAVIVQDTTDQAHIHKYFRLRRPGKINQWLNAGQKDRRYVNLGWQGYLEAIHEEAKKIIEVDIDAQVTRAKSESQRRQTWAYSEIEFASIDQTFPSCCDRLIQENPDEYLRQADLYQHKLLKTNNESEVLAFGNSWIKNLPKEATWEQVENMSFILIQAAKTNGGADLTEFRAGVQWWLEEHPLIDNPDSVNLTPDQTTSSSGRRTYIVGLLYFHNQNLDLSPEAFQIYQSCGALYSDEHSWKVLQSLYHIENRQWVEAEHLLAGLPEDDASVRNTQRNLHYFLQERISSAGMDVGLIALSRFVPSSYRETATFDIGYTGLQLLTNGTTRRMWVPRLLGIPERAISFNPFLLPLSARISMLGDVVDCVFRRIVDLMPSQSKNFAKYTFVSCTARTANTVYTLCTDPLQLSIPSLVNLGSQFISVNQSLDECREIRRSPTRQAFSSTLQLMASDLVTAYTIVSYSDLIPVVKARFPQITSPSVERNLSIQTVSDLSTASEESSRDKWFLAAIGIGSWTTFRFYRDYPYLWAASVMRDVEFYSSKGNYEDVQRVLTEAENCYFVSSVRPAVKDYALYADWLKDYPSFLEDPAKCQAFLIHMDLVLNIILNASSHYRGVRNNVLLKKLETAIRQQDPRRLEEVFKENPNNKIVIFGFHFFLNHTLDLALKDPVEACNLLESMKSSFPPSSQPTIESFLELLQAQSDSLKEWPQLKMLSGQQNPLSSTKASQWVDELQQLQDFFSQNVGETRVHQDLQYYKLMIAFAQTDDTEQMEALFETSTPEIHQRFSLELVQCTRQLRKTGSHQEATSLLKRAKINSFTDNHLIQNYGHFLFWVYSLNLHRDAVLERMKDLDSCIACLDTKNPVHQQLHVFFSACRIVLSLDIGDHANAQKLLAQEQTDLKVLDEVASLLFERVLVSIKENRGEKALSDLKCIIENLGPWQHLELFKAYHAYLVCEPSLEALFECSTNVLTQIEPIEQLSEFATHLQHRKRPLEFELRLLQEDFAAAKYLLTGPMPRKLKSQLYNILFTFFIHRGEQLRQTKPLSITREILQSLKISFNAPNSHVFQSYVDFLDLLDKVKGEKEFATYFWAYQSLEKVFEKLNSIDCVIPESLKAEQVNILLKVATLAKDADQPKIGLAALESIKKLVIPDDELNQYISYLKQQLSA